MADGSARLADVTSGAGEPAPRLDERLLIWLSPQFPVGSFAYSHGLELAVERGWVGSRDSLAAWLLDLVRLGSVRNDLVLLAAAWRAAAQGEGGALEEVNALALALQPSAERHLETTTQGKAFLATVGAAWPSPALAALLPPLAGDAAYPVAVGTATAAHCVPLAGALHAYAVAVASSLVSAAVRLSVVGQTDGQRVLASLVPALAEAAAAARASSLDDLGSTTLRSDLASLAHETQYSRLFRS